MSTTELSRDPVGTADGRRLVDVVLVTADFGRQVLDCVAHLDEPEVHSIVVVDNGSAGGIAEAIETIRPAVTVIRLDVPIGLAAALNRGAALGDAPFILYLNDDVFAAPGAVRILLDTLRGRADAVAAGGRLVEPSMVTQDRYRPRSFPSAATLAARVLGLERLWPRNPWTGGHLRRRLDDEQTVAVDQPAGACLLVRRSVVEQLDGWDERYWFWYEDVDFALRLADHGACLYVPKATFRHVGGATARRLAPADGHRRVHHGILVYASTHFTHRGRAGVGLALALTSALRAATAVRSDRAAARVYATATRTSLALIAGRPVAGVTDTQGGPRPARAGTRCIVCHSPAVATARFRPTRLLECTGCGLLFRAAPPHPDAVRDMYRDDSYAAARMNVLTDPDRARQADQRVRWIEPRVAGRRLLDVGAGAGYFVARAGERGFTAIGIEPSELAASWARTELGVDVRTGFLETADLPTDGFDAVCMWHVLEHAADPLSLLRDVHARFRPGGRLVIEVPNIDSVAAAMLRGRWAHLDPSAHACHFTPHSLTVALAASGYELLELETLLESYYDRLSDALRPRRLAGRAVRAVRLRTARKTHPSRGELLRAVATPAP